MRIAVGCVIAVVCTWALAQVLARAQESDVVYDEETKLASFVDLTYPPVAMMARVQGVVVVTVSLKRDGSVADAHAEPGDPSILREAAVANARKWMFVPNARRRAVIVYDFRMGNGACHESTRSVFLLQHFNFASIIGCDPVISG